MLDAHKFSKSSLIGRSPQRSPGWSHSPSLEQLIGEEKRVSVRLRKLRGFPDREEVPLERRMDYEAFEEHWHRELNYNRDHTVLQSQDLVGGRSGGERLMRRTGLLCRRGRCSCSYAPGALSLWQLERRGGSCPRSFREASRLFQGRLGGTVRTTAPVPYVQQVSP